MNRGQEPSRADSVRKSGGFIVWYQLGMGGLFLVLSPSPAHILCVKVEK